MCWLDDMVNSLGKISYTGTFCKQRSKHEIYKELSHILIAKSLKIWWYFFKMNITLHVSAALGRDNTYCSTTNLAMRAGGKSTCNESRFRNKMNDQSLQDKVSYKFAVPDSSWTYSCVFHCKINAKSLNCWCVASSNIFPKAPSPPLPSPPPPLPSPPLPSPPLPSHLATSLLDYT